MKRRPSRSGLPFELGDLERYGVLALAAALVLGVACLLHAVQGRTPPFRSVAFASDRLAGAPVEIPERPPAALARSGDVRSTDVRRVDAPGGGEVPPAAPAPATKVRPARAEAHRADFDFFEPPVRLAGKPAPLAPPPPGSTCEPRVVVVQKGDSLQKIAARELGDANQWRTLIQWNPGVDPKRLKPRQELKLPPPARVAPSREATTTRLHEVVADDTLQSIAERYYGDRARWIDLFQANRDQLRAPSDLKAGSKIRIP
ncbi:MAG TPA: LysM peptidoglycan-binding domain-containing protein [Planctomycetota bacterium]|nr:LysM peptidoglycan-binding domain-containing protein [Planctomycetota bacterium]